MKKAYCCAFFAAVMFALFLFVAKISCPIRAFLGFPCPTCGVTRALFSLFHLRFGESLRYNAMAIPLCAALLVCFAGNHTKRRGICIGFSVAVSILNFGYYCYRLIFGLIP